MSDGWVTAKMAERKWRSLRILTWAIWAVFQAALWTAVYYRWEINL